MKNSEKDENLIDNSKNNIKSSSKTLIVVICVLSVLIVTAVGLSIAWFIKNKGMSQALQVNDVQASVLYNQGSGEKIVIPSSIAKADLVNAHLYIKNNNASSIRVRVKLLLETDVDGVMVADPTYTITLADSTAWELDEDDGYYYYNQPLTEKDETVPFVTSISTDSGDDTTTKIYALIECVQPDRNGKFFYE